MFATTHIALPVIAAQALNLRNFVKCGTPLFTRWQFIAIGICGMLPDIVNPHLGLEARYSSGSHTAWFFFGYSLLSIISAKFLPQRHKLTLHLCWFAVLLHIICDLASGGINPIPPYSGIIGDYWIAPEAWLYTDLFCIITAYVFYVITRNKLKRVLPANQTHFARPPTFVEEA